MTTAPRINKWIANFKNYLRFAVIDTETTDKYWNSSAPIQIAALICDKEGIILDTFDERIKTNHRIAPTASAVHGIYAKDLVNCRSEKEVLTDFCLWLKDNKVDCIITYNGESFDRPLLNERCKILDIPVDYFDKEKFPGIDGYYDCVLDAKRENYQGLKIALGRKWNLSAVSQFFNISTENAHDALADVTMLKRLFWKLDPIIHPERWGSTETHSLFG